MLIDDDVRRYTLQIAVEVRPQIDLRHFQPYTVTACAPDLGLKWVSGSDAEALRDFFHFFVRQHHFEVVPGDDIAARALHAWIDAQGKRD
jgi:hypothetical protein